jgi:hypothetical protein
LEERNLEERNLEKVPSDGNPMIRRLAMCVAMAKVLAMSGAVLASALLLAFALSGCGHIERLPVRG